MLFNSFEFICIFFPLVTGLYFILPHRWRWLLLLVASCWFYMTFVPVYILILAFTIGVDYFAGIWIDRSEGRKRKLLLAASIVANVGVLAFFKYFNFLNESIAALVRGIATLSDENGRALMGAAASATLLEALSGNLHASIGKFRLCQGPVSARLDAPGVGEISFF